MSSVPRVGSGSRPVRRSDRLPETAHEPFPVRFVARVTGLGLDKAGMTRHRHAGRAAARCQVLQVSIGIEGHGLPFGLVGQEQRRLRQFTDLPDATSRTTPVSNGTLRLKLPSLIACQPLSNRSPDPNSRARE